VHNRQNTHPSTGLGGGMTSGVKFGLAHSSNGFLDDFSEFVCDLAYIIFDSSSVFSRGSFDIIRDSGRWLIIAGQE
jgi:hypothetical protein